MLEIGKRQEVYRTHRRPGVIDDSYLNFQNGFGIGVDPKDKDMGRLLKAPSEEGGKQIRSAGHSAWHSYR